MDDELKLYVGTVVVPDDTMMSWRSAVELVFAEGDFRDCLHSRAEPAVRERLAHLRQWSSRLLYLISPADAVRARMQIQGYTPAYCRTVWASARDELAARRHRALQRGERFPTGTDTVELEKLAYEDWLAMVREQHAAGEVSRGVRRHRPWQAVNLLGLVTNPIVSLLLLLDAIGGPVWLNCASLYDYEPDTSLSPHALLRRDAEREGSWQGGKIVVLTEGRSDTRVISAALRAFYPALADAYQFLAFDEFRIEGGASPLARMVKVLSGARMSNRMLALFDNDAAGVEALRSVGTLALPHTVRLMALPDIASASRYPTIGPGGRNRMNVNGAAASIELYLGRGPLTANDGTLRPVRWTEWRQQINRYQGAVVGKDEVVEKFLHELATERRPGILRRRFPDMNKLLMSIFVVFEDLSPPVFWMG